MVKQGIPYRNIQSTLKAQFGSGISNTTFKKIRDRAEHDQSLEARIEELERELALFKRLYFELLERVGANTKDNGNIYKE